MARCHCPCQNRSHNVSRSLRSGISAIFRGRGRHVCQECIPSVSVPRCPTAHAHSLLCSLLVHSPADVRLTERIANIDLNAVIDASTLVQVLSDEKVTGLNPKYGKLRLSLDITEDVPGIYRQYWDQFKDQFKGFRALVGSWDEDPLVVICNNYLGYPRPTEILNPPD